MLGEMRVEMMAVVRDGRLVGKRVDKMVGKRVELMDGRWVE